MKMTGAEIFAECLRREGVKTIFGIPGGVVLKIFDVLYDAPGIETVLARHEQGATFMAQGYARATGRPAVVLATSGPGATNIMTGLADAYMDSVPLVAITGQVSTQLIGNDAFQEADSVGISRPITKYNYLVKDVKDLAQTLKEAFYIAGTGRPGPVLVDIPKDVAQAEAEFVYPEKVFIRSYNPTYEGNRWQIKQAAAAILKAKRPVILAGGGVIWSGATAELRELAEQTRIPVITTLMGLGGFPATHPLFLSMPGMHGSYFANMAIYEADLLIGIGARFDDRVTGKVSEFTKADTLIHIDIDPTTINKNLTAHIPIVGDVKTVLRELNGLLKAGPDVISRAEQRCRPWWNQIHDWATQHPLTYRQDMDAPALKPQYVIGKLYEATAGEDAIVSTDVGQHQMWTAQLYKFTKPHTFLTSGGLGSMGFGFPAALGAQKAFPERLVLCVTGDGSVQMNVQELATAVVYRLPVKIVLINNNYHGMVRQWQQLFYRSRYSGSCMEGCPDYVKLAEAYGAVGLRATKPREVEDVIHEALTTPGPVLMDFQVDPNENCYPMVPAGGANHAMLMEDPAFPSAPKTEPAPTPEVA